MSMDTGPRRDDRDRRAEADGPSASDVGDVSGGGGGEETDVYGDMDLSTKGHEVDRKAIEKEYGASEPTDADLDRIMSAPREHDAREPTEADLDRVASASREYGAREREPTAADLDRILANRDSDKADTPDDDR